MVPSKLPISRVVGEAFGVRRAVPRNRPLHSLTGNKPARPATDAESATAAVWRRRGRRVAP
jgi:hypothetical protein